MTARTATAGRRRLLAIGLAVAVLAAGCSDDGDPGAAPATTGECVPRVSVADGWSDRAEKLTAAALGDFGDLTTRPLTDTTSVDAIERRALEPWTCATGIADAQAAAHLLVDGLATVGFVFLLPVPDAVGLERAESGLPRVVHGLADAAPGAPVRSEEVDGTTLRSLPVEGSDLRATVAGYLDRDRGVLVALLVESPRSSTGLLRERLTDGSAP